MVRNLGKETVSKQKRSQIMAAVKHKDTKPETTLRSLLHRAGYRFRLYPANLPGSPDIVLPRYHTAIFVHGCFWHRHEGCKKASTPTQNREFWLEKFSKNVERDRRKQNDLELQGWRVLTVWECEITSHAQETLKAVEEFLGCST